MLARDLRPGDIVMTPSGRTAVVLKLMADDNFVSLRYLDEPAVNAEEERRNELTLAVRYCRPCLTAHSAQVLKASIPRSPR